MHYSYTLTTRCTILAIFTLILFQSIFADGYLHGQSLHAGTELGVTHKRETPQDHEENARNMYGDGVRIGSYLQASAYLLGFFAPQDTDPKGQFSGIILAFQLLIRWWFRFPTDKISIPELWVSLAQLYIFTTPGAFLLFLGFSTTRRHWKTTRGRELSRHKVIRGEGLNFVQVFAILAWLHITAVVFCIKIYHSSDPNDRIWMMGIREVRSPEIRAFVLIHAIVILCLEAPPYFFYLFAWLKYVIRVIRFRESHNNGERRRNWYNRIEQSDENPRKSRHRINRVLQKLYSTTLFWMLVYVAILIASIEATIVEADLKPQQDILHDPGQLLPLLTGIFAVVSVLVNNTNGKGNPLSAKTPVRYERSPKGHILIYTKDGNPLEEDELALLRAPPRQMH